MNDSREHHKANEEKWDNWARTFDNKWAAPFRYLQKQVISIANIQPDTTLLDIGCGTGWALRYAAGLLNGRGNFVGVDISEGMIAKAKEHSRELLNIKYYRASAEELPLDDSCFDMIICTNSFHHYLNPAKALDESCRVLKQKGRIHILDITTDDLITRWIDAFIKKMEKEHVKQYSTSEFEHMFSEAGLKYITSKIIMAYPFKVHIAEKGMK